MASMAEFLIEVACADYLTGRQSYDKLLSVTERSYANEEVSQTEIDVAVTEAASSLKRAIVRDLEVHTRITATCGIDPSDTSRGELDEVVRCGRGGHPPRV